MDFLKVQDGVVSRQQLLSLGWQPHHLRRALRRRELAAIHAGVYVDHTGPPSWNQRAWAALALVSSDAQLRDVALSHDSALRIVEGPGLRDKRDDPIHVMTAHDRKVRARGGVIVHRCEHFEARTMQHLRPPRVRYDDAVLDVASRRSNIDAVALLARAVGDRRTTAGRLLEVLAKRGHIANRRWLRAVLSDVQQGTHSVLEHGFLTEVVRPHELPEPARQGREVTQIGVAFRDAAYGDILIELDGRAFHSSFVQRDADLDRDLAAAATGRQTVRLGWGQVFERPCQTAALLSDVLRQGKVSPCGRGCTVSG